MTYKASGAELVIAKGAAANRELIGMLGLPNGKIAFEWADVAGDGTSTYKGALFDGVTLGATRTLSGTPDAVLANGNAIAIEGQGTSTLTGQFYNAKLGPTGDPLTLFDPASAFGFPSDYAQILSPVVAPLTKGGFVVSFGVRFNGSSEAYLYAQRFNATGEAKSELVFVGAAGNNAISQTAELTDGHIAVVNLVMDQISIFSADLTGTPTVIDVKGAGSFGEARIAALPNGAFVVVWDENISSGGYSNVGTLHAQVFNSAGAAISDDIIVDSVGPAHLFAIDLAVLSSGDFAIAWAKHEGTSNSDVAVKTFSANGDEIGFEQRVNTETAGNQYSVHLPANTDGSFTVGWSSFATPGQNTTSPEVHAQVFTSTAGVTLTGTSGADILTGTKRDDLLAGLAGDDRLDGGDGNDTATYAKAGAGVQVSLTRLGAQDTGGAGADKLSSIENLIGSRFGDTLVGDDHRNVLTGGGGADRLVGGGANDRLVGGGGADELVGGLGADVMVGGIGDDTYRVDNAHDVVVESHAVDPETYVQLGGTDRVISAVDYFLPQFVENLTLMEGSGAINGTGNGGANIIVGNESANVLNGRGGADRLIGGGGADHFVFDTYRSPSDTTIVRIADFGRGNDKIYIDPSISYTFYDHPLGALDKSDLAIGTKATTADQHLIYNPATGALFLDQDGIGGLAQMKIAILSNAPDLSAADIILFI